MRKPPNSKILGGPLQSNVYGIEFKKTCRGAAIPKMGIQRITIHLNTLHKHQKNSKIQSPRDSRFVKTDSEKTSSNKKHLYQQNFKLLWVDIFLLEQKTKIKEQKEVN